MLIIRANFIHVTLGIVIDWNILHHNNKFLQNIIFYSHTFSPAMLSLAFILLNISLVHEIYLVLMILKSLIKRGLINHQWLPWQSTREQLSNIKSRKSREVDLSNKWMKVDSENTFSTIHPTFSIAGQTCSVRMQHAAPYCTHCITLCRRRVLLAVPLLHRVAAPSDELANV